MEKIDVFKFFATIFITVNSIAGGLSLTIDNQLVIIANDCYTRIAIGSILPTKDIAVSVIAATVTECEDECSRKRSTCEIFSFGISSKGNASCLLGTRIPNAEELVSNSDYDIYIRQQSSPHCMPDRLYKLGSGDRNPTNYKTDENRDGEIEDKRNGHNDTSRGPKPAKRPSVGIGFGTVAIPNADNGNRAQNHYPGTNYQNNFNGYQVSEEIPNFPPGYNNPQTPIFHDEDNPNPPYIYGTNNKNPYDGSIVQISGYGGGNPSGNYKPQGNLNFNTGYNQPVDTGSADFYPQLGSPHQIEHKNHQDNYYSHGSIDQESNRYGIINVYDQPDSLCKLLYDF